MTLRQLRVFVAVARRESATAAGIEIGLSQSAASSAVQQLEASLGVPLFDRVGKRMIPNERARALLPRARALLEDALVFERAAHDGHERDTLRIGSSTTIGNYVLPDLLARYYGRDELSATAAPWESKVRIANTADICRAVANFELDIGIVEGPSHEPALRSLPWLQDEMLIVAAADDPYAGTRRKLDVGALRAATWLLREPGSGTREVADEMLLPWLQSYPRVRVLASSEAIKRATAAGLGLACLSRWVVGEMLADRKLRVLNTVIPPAQRQCHVVLHRTKRHTPVIDALLELLAQER